MGEHLAKSSMFLMFASFMHSFHVDVPAGQELPDLVGLDGITLTPKPYDAVLTPRAGVMERSNMYNTDE